MHLAHLPSPETVTSLPLASLSSANAGVANASKSSPARPVITAILVFICVYCFPLFFVRFLLGVMAVCPPTSHRLSSMQLGGSQENSWVRVKEMETKG